MPHTAFCLPEELTFLEPKSHLEIKAIRDYNEDYGPRYRLFVGDQYLGDQMNDGHMMAQDYDGPTEVFDDARKQLQHLIGMYFDETSL